MSHAEIMGWFAACTSRTVLTRVPQQGRTRLTHVWPSNHPNTISHPQALTRVGRAGHQRAQLRQCAVLSRRRQLVGGVPQRPAGPGGGLLQRRRGQGFLQGGAHPFVPGPCASSWDGRFGVGASAWSGPADRRLVKLGLFWRTQAKSMTKL